jgi:hypothetical protein
MSSLEKNRAEMYAQKQAGQLLFQSFHRTRGMDEDNVPFDEELFAECIQENDRAKLTKKTHAQLMLSGPKSSADWSFFLVKIFMKSQQKVKPDNLNGGWKAGQTLAQMNDQWLLLFGPVVRYIVKKDSLNQEDRIFILGGSTLTGMYRWCEKHIRGNQFTTNDYTAFDQSQGAEAVHFELAHMAYYSFPRGFLDVYEEQKCSLNHQFGRSAIMRFTGEPGTYKFNTMFSEALMNLQYDLSGPYMVSGDDSLIVGFARESKIWASVKHRFKIVSKTEFIAQPLFCGFICTRYGIIREPIHFAMKLALAVVNGKFDDVAVSYATEYQLGYQLGGLVDEILNDEQREAHAVVANHLYKNSPGRVRSMFSTMALSDNQAIKFGVNMVAALKGKTLFEAYQSTMKGF